MSAAYYIVFDKSSLGFDPFVIGKFLSKESHLLATIAESCGQKTLDDFVSFAPDEAVEMMEELGGDTGETELPLERWYSADDGISWVQAMMAEVERHRMRFENADGVMSDLREYEQVFGQTKAIGAKWHLQVDF